MSSEDKALARLRLLRSPRIGPITYRTLIASFGSAEAALETLPRLAARHGHPHKFCTLAAVRTEWRAAMNLGAQPLFVDDQGYPPELAATDDAPPLLWMIGNSHLLKRPRVAIVGGRDCSLNGRRLTEHFARALTDANYVVVSGFARGIDSAAHKGALEGGTCAVLAGGIDNCYPPENQQLYQAIADSGLLLSEMPPGTQPLGRHFPRRNRIVSGLSLGCLVVEAAARSGSLITARLALDQGREVFVVPGFPGDRRAAGGNRLIRQGAHLVETPEHLLEVLGGMRPSILREGYKKDYSVPVDLDHFSSERLTQARAALLEATSFVPCAIDDLIRELDLVPALVQIALLELELAGIIQRVPGGCVVRIGE